MITRERAQERINDIINSGFISDDLEKDLQDISDCIEYEQYGLHMWGADDYHFYTLSTSMRTDLPEYSEHIKEKKAIEAKYRFRPSKFEKETIDEG